MILEDTMIEGRFKAHIEELQKRYEDIFSELSEQGTVLDGVLIHSGVEDIYFQDDNHMPFKAYAHFLHWVPVSRSDQAVLIQPGKKPVYYQVIPRDFWYDQSVSVEPWWADCFGLVELERSTEIIDHLPQSRRLAFLGRATDFAGQMGLASPYWNLPALLHRVNWQRAYKTEYEIACMRKANELAVVSHQAAKECFLAGGSELDIHLAYLQKSKMMEYQSPYMNIVALDRNSAILHYQYKGTQSSHESQVMLIDAGSTCNFYGSDLTRTYARESAHPVFKKLIDAVDRIQLDLVAEVKPGRPYLHIHLKAHEMILDALLEHGLVFGDRAELEKHRVSHLFFPHGIGHILGLQVHDVGGHYADPGGKLKSPPEDHPFLRLTRTMDPGMTFTIEPGLYFIPVLLNPERQTKRGSYLNWSLIDELIPLGGIRIEDNILVTETGVENLTR
ncbi:MAG: Xaa-Pro dipeptidase [Acidobacteria bacterium]|nr:MAG: Xaa-Pro dipeptidase [Acidobacteriota bacterium]